MSLGRAIELLEEATENATGLRGSVSIRARLVLARTALRDERLDDAVAHLEVVCDRTHRDAVSVPAGNALQLLQTTAVRGGESA